MRRTSGTPAAAAIIPRISLTAHSGTKPLARQLDAGQRLAFSTCSKIALTWPWSGLPPGGGAVGDGLAGGEGAGGCAGRGCLAVAAGVEQVLPGGPGQPLQCLLEVHGRAGAPAAG